MEGHHAKHSGQRLANLDACVLTRGTTERGKRSDVTHYALQVNIDCSRSCAREWSKVYGPCCELAMHPVRNERSEGSEEPACNGDYLVKRCECGPIVLAVDLVEAVPTLAHVPLRDVLVEKSHHSLCGVGSLVATEELVRFVLDARESRQNPSIQQGPVLRQGVISGWPPSEVRVLRENPRIDVLEREEKASRRITNTCFVKAPWRPELTRRG